MKPKLTLIQETVEVAATAADSKAAVAKVVMASRAVTITSEKLRDLLAVAA